MTGDAWERLPDPKPRLTLEVVEPNGQKWEFFLGPHTPRMRDEDIQLMHRMWLEITSDREFAGLHHYDIVALALQELEKELEKDPSRAHVLHQLRDRMRERQ